jgi:hypothetical protein
MFKRITENETWGECEMHGRKTKFLQIALGYFEGKPLKRRRLTWEDDIKWILK